MEKNEIAELEKELKVPVVPKLDLSPFTKIASRNPKMKIGVLKEDIAGLSNYKKGDMVLFTPYTVEECYGKMDWKAMENHVQLCTIEVPSILYFKDKKGTSTIKTTVGVPLKLIDYEIVI